MDAAQFEWDEQNIGHLARHHISPEEAEQAILNRPVDLESHIRSGEDRMVQIGETDAGRVLIVVSSMRDKKVRVITAWPANRKYRGYFSSMKGNGNVGRTEEQGLQE